MTLHDMRERICPLPLLAGGGERETTRYKIHAASEDHSTKLPFQSFKKSAVFTPRDTFFPQLT